MTTEKTFDIIGRRKLWYILSAIIIIPCIVSLFVWGLNIGIDFAGGTQQQIEYPNGTRPHTEVIREAVQKAEVKAVAVQTSGDNNVLIRFANENDKTARALGDAIIKEVQTLNPEAKEVSFENIGGSVAKSTTTKASWAVAITAIALIIYIAWSFASVPKPANSWRFGLSAIAALLHDILFVIGAFSIIGHYIPSVEVDALFITAILTILGFSVNDTIVVFDRLRENLRRNPGKSFEDIANISLNQTLARSINTSATVLIVLTSLLVLGGESIRNFVLALTLGVFIGTYSSIFNASPILVSWQGYINKRSKR